ncbi:hypothetical protein QCA50_010838 [Cerrena zonata]|uniref:Uncharacterized protein n=1 Tax=Cerrena zonata TaxID=2478898 RepID=A0AAW0G3C7_9APHY
MPPPRNWASPPTRREISLVLFAFTIFVLTYNIETSLRAVGVNTKLNAGYLSTLGFGNKDPGLDPDGRRPVEWRDDLEKVIVGDWDWKEGDIASVEHAQESLILLDLGDAVEASTYIYKAGSGKTASRSATKEAIGVGLNKGVTLGGGLVWWGEKGNNIPDSRALVHVPGYTVFENLFMLNGTFYLVADKPSLLPPLGSIASSSADRSQPPTPKDWRIIDKEEATTLFGRFGGVVQGTTWLSTDPAESQDLYTLFSLYRTHSYLSLPHASRSFTSSSGLKIIGAETTGGEDVTPPVRLVFPRVPSFSSPGLPPVDGNPKTHPPLRIKSYNGLHLHFLKAIFPTMGIQYSEDFQDYVDLHVPYIYDRIIVADSGAAERGRDQWTVGWVAPPRKAGSGELRRRDDDEIESEVSVAGHQVEIEVEKDEVEVELKTPSGNLFRATPNIGLSIPQRRNDETELEITAAGAEAEVEVEKDEIEAEIETKNGNKLELELENRDEDTGVEVEIDKDEAEVELKVAGVETELELEDKKLEVEIERRSIIHRRDDETELEVKIAGVEAEVELEKGKLEVELETEDGHETEVELRKRADDDQSGKPVWAAPFVGLTVPEGWWTPVREALLSYLRLPSDIPSSNDKQTKPRSPTRSKKPILTYVSMQMEPAAAGAKLRSEDHLALLRGLRKLEIDGVLSAVNLVRGNGSMEVWQERMNSIVQSSIVIGPYGPQMADSVFMPAPLPVTQSSSEESAAQELERSQNSAPLLIEFFPPGLFRRDQEYAVRSLGMKYIAWWNGRKFAGNSLPPVMGLSNERLPHTQGMEITLDTDAVVQTIREEALRIAKAL